MTLDRALSMLVWGLLGLASGIVLGMTGCTQPEIGGAIKGQAGRIPSRPFDAGSMQPPAVPDAGTTIRADAALPIDASQAPPPPPVDAGGAPPPTEICGDGTCNPADETCSSCEADCGPCTWPQDQAREEEAMVQMVNDFRAMGARCGARSYGPAGPVTMNAELRAAARGHSTDMADNNYFDHTSRDGRSPWDRIREAGYQGSGVGENIAAGNASAQATFQQWVNSPGHCANMMNGSANEMGLGYAVGDARFRHYWTQVFGRR